MLIKCNKDSEHCRVIQPDCQHRVPHEVDEDGGCEIGECSVVERKAVCTPLPFTTNITGLAHSGYKLFASKVVVGTELTMLRDPENAYDKFAIQLLMPDETKLGWVQKLKAEEGVVTAQQTISNLLDAGYNLTCIISEIDPAKKEAEGKIKAIIDFKQETN